MKIKQTFISDDGYEFNSEADCKNYELSDLYKVRKIYDTLSKPRFLQWDADEVPVSEFICETGFTVLKEQFLGGGCMEYLGKINNKVFIFRSYNYRVKKNSFEFLE